MNSYFRRLLLDDAKGVTEALNEKAYGVGLVAKGMRFLLYFTYHGISNNQLQENIKSYSGNVT